MDTNEQTFAMENDPATMDMDSDEFKAVLNAFDSDGEGEATDTDGGESNKQDESSATSGAADPKDGEQGDATKVAGVLSPDGKHIIPYGALKQAREEASTHRKAAEEAQARIAELQAQLNQKPGDEIDGDVDDGEAKTADLDAKRKQLADDFPEFGEVASAMRAQIADLQKQVNGYNVERQAKQQEAANQRQQTMREAIDSNPHLSLWETEQPEAWERAVEFDKVLRERPDWKGKPYSERFEKVVALVRADFPDAKLPASISPPSKETKVELEAKVQAALDEAGEYVPESLSHIPGGKAPSQNDGRLDPVDLEAFFEKASQDQIDAYLAKFG